MLKKEKTADHFFIEKSFLDTEKQCVYVPVYMPKRVDVTGDINYQNFPYLIELELKKNI